MKPDKNKAKYRRKKQDTEEQNTKQDKKCDDKFILIYYYHRERHARKQLQSKLDKEAREDKNKNS